MLNDIQNLIRDHIIETGKEPKHLIVSENVRQKLLTIAYKEGAYRPDSTKHETVFGLILSTAVPCIDDYIEVL